MSTATETENWKQIENTLYWGGSFLLKIFQHAKTIWQFVKSSCILVFKYGSGDSGILWNLPKHKKMGEKL